MADALSFINGNLMEYWENLVVDVETNIHNGGTKDIRNATLKKVRDCNDELRRLIVNGIDLEDRVSAQNLLRLGVDIEKIIGEPAHISKHYYGCESEEDHAILYDERVCDELIRRAGLPKNHTKTGRIVWSKVAVGDHEDTDLIRSMDVCPVFVRDFHTCKVGGTRGMVFDKRFGSVLRQLEFDRGFTEGYAVGWDDKENERDYDSEPRR